MLLSKPTVLQLIGSFDEGGSERQAVQLTRLLVEDGSCRVLVACLDADGALRADIDGLKLDSIPAFPLRSFYHPASTVQLLRFAAHLRRERVAIVQTHDFYTNVFGLAGAALAGVPGRIGARRETGGVRTPGQLKVERAVYRLAGIIVANAEAVGRQLISEGVPAGKIATVYNGLDLARVAPTSGLDRAARLARLGLPDEPKRQWVTIVANLHYDVKDHATFLRAARRVREAAPDAAFALAGDGRLTGRMRQLAAGLGIAPHTFFLGRCTAVADLLAVSDVCVLSSKAEGFSNAILEYMAAGRPVVATDTGGAREAIENGASGFLVAPGDDEDMARRILSLLQDPALASAMGRRGRRIVEEKFSCRAQLRRTLEVYERLLARTASPAS